VIWWVGCCLILPEAERVLALLMKEEEGRACHHIINSEEPLSCGWGEFITWEGFMVEKNSKKKEGIVKKEISRRDFIKTTALGAAGFGLSSWVPVPFTYGAEPPIKIGMYQEYTVGATQYGYWMGKVGKAAIAKLNAEGGIAGRKVELFD